jgi:hypothetical protein
MTAKSMLAGPFNGVPRSTYRNDVRWNSEQRAVDFTLDLHSDVDHRVVPCRVSWETLCDAAHGADKGDASKAMQLYDRFGDRIKAIIAAKVRSASYEPDGSVLVRSAELSR